MLDQLRPLIVVLGLALVVFALAKPVCLRFMTAQDFARRRNVWLCLTFTAFVAPNLWLFAAVALPLTYWAGRVDRHPTAVYLLLLLAVPPASLPIPMPLINQLFELSNFRILEFAILVPAAFRILGSERSQRGWGRTADVLVLAFGALQLVLYVPYETFTHTMRRAFLFMLDTYFLYYVFSRAAANREALRDSLCSFWLACAIIAPIALFETLKGWLLFTGIPERWGDPNTLSWLLRGDSLRAQASVGHSLTMGYVLAIAFGFWLYLAGHLDSKRNAWLGGIWLWLGLLAAYSRAPWLVAAAAGCIYLLGSPAGRRGLVRTVIGLAVIAVPFLMTPQGARLVETLPFIGTVDQFNVDYREQLATLSWQLIKLNPMFGSPFAAQHMESLRQGQGIIDIVNTYAWVSLFYGLVGCALFVGAFAFPLARCLFAIRALRSSDPDAVNLGVVLVACMSGTLLMMATASFGNSFEQMSWALAGLCSAYAAAMFDRTPARHGDSMMVSRGAAPMGSR
ncbi:MAG: O-antigen ligase family protein [Pseudomonadota bacterium]